MITNRCELWLCVFGWLPLFALQGTSFSTNPRSPPFQVFFSDGIRQKHSTGNHLAFWQNELNASLASYARGQREMVFWPPLGALRHMKTMNGNCKHQERIAWYSQSLVCKESSTVEASEWRCQLATVQMLISALGKMKSFVWLNWRWHNLNCCSLDDERKIIQ